MGSCAEALANWAHDYTPDAAALALADRSLADTAAVALAARDHPVRALAAQLPDAARWAILGHVLDFDDLHVESTSHISVVVVPAVLASGGDARAYLAGAGVMARLGTMLGWRHYSSGWHATCTAGAPAAAVAAGVAWGLTPERLAVAMALAVPAAGGLQRAFGTDAKSLQVGFTAEAGVRAARLASAGASADPRVLDAWLELLSGETTTVDTCGPAVPGGLAVKIFPCCYALQRPIAALHDIKDAIDGAVTRVRVTTPEGTMQPLVHDRPRTGLEGKFSMQYAIAATLLDHYPGFGSFTDLAVTRPDAARLVSLVEVDRTPGGTDLLDGAVAIDVELTGGRALHTELRHPPGSPALPPNAADLDGKLADCGPDVPALLRGATWDSVRELLRAELGGAGETVR